MSAIKVYEKNLKNFETWYLIIIKILKNSEYSNMFIIEGKKIGTPGSSPRIYKLPSTIISVTTSYYLFIGTRGMRRGVKLFRTMQNSTSRLLYILLCT